MPLFSRSALLSILVLTGLLPNVASASATYKIGASLDLGSLDIPLVDVPGTTGNPSSDGIVKWWMPDPYSINVGGIELGEVTKWDVWLKEDPFVINNINITNTTGFTILYTASVLLPIPAFPYNAVVNSSVGVTATDDDADNALLVDEDSGIPFYRGRVNGVDVLPLTPPAIPITTADCTVPGPSFPGCTATSSNGVAFFAAGGVANNIEIILRFTLSPGDSIGITSRFEIVPEPSTGLLLGLGVLALALKRRQSH